MNFPLIVMIVAMILLVWDCIEVGRNDAANLVNAVFGARVLERRTAVILAGIAVIAGATMASPVIETARSGLFDPGLLTLKAAMTIYVTAYIVDTLLLYGYSAFGMPVSTTASLVFELIGAAIAVAASLGIVHWDKAGEVLLAIVISIAISGIAAFLFQRIFRGAIREKSDDPMQVLLHGPWIGGLLLTWLLWFMITKGMKGLPFAKLLRTATLDAYGPVLTLMVLWGGLTLLIHLALSFTRERGAHALFRITTVAGMLCMAFAFGQNDLANCASPGLATLQLWRHAETGVAAATSVPLPIWALFGCGLLMALGMQSKNAQRVTRAAVNTGSQFDHVAIYAPAWCRALARRWVGKTDPAHVQPLAPPPQLDAHGKRVHFDPLRASVIMAVSAGVIAFASARGLPVSTTYVAFAAVVATGMADRVMSYGDADLKIGRAIWVVFSWFGGALLAMVASALVAFVIIRLGTAGLALTLGANLILRPWIKRQSDRHEMKYHVAAAAEPATVPGGPAGTP
jgi:phosphate/sulfate permease